MIRLPAALALISLACVDMPPLRDASTHDAARPDRSVDACTPLLLRQQAPAMDGDDYLIEQWCGSCRSQLRPGAREGQICRGAADCQEVCCPCPRTRAAFNVQLCSYGHCVSPSTTCLLALDQNPTLCR